MAWPTTSAPKTEFATLRMTAAEAAALDAVADGNRSAYVRRAVANQIAADSKKARRKAGLAQKNEAGA